jgi:hypothetical protein
MTTTIRSAAALVAALLWTLTAADAAPRPKTVRLLTIGNSFSGNATHFLGDLAKAGGHVLVHQSMSIGGASMEVHWTKIQANERIQGPAGPLRAPEPERRAETGDWSRCSRESIVPRPDTYRPSPPAPAVAEGDALKAELPSTRPGPIAATILCRFGPKAAKGEPASREAMHAGLSAAYLTIAKELGVRRLPVGDAFNLADGDPKWGYKPDASFDRAKAAAPALPDQTHSLHAGWRWSTAKDGKQALAMDGHHAGAAGEYLGACVWYEVLFKESAVGNPFAPKDLSPEDAKYLQEGHHAARPPSRAK